MITGYILILHLFCHVIFQARVLEWGAIAFILLEYINKRNVF